MLAAPAGGVAIEDGLVDGVVDDDLDLVGGQSVGLPWKHGSTEVKYGAIVDQVWPPLKDW